MAHQPVEPNSMQESGRGFFLVSTFADDLDAYARREKGMVVQTVLPVEREPSQDLDPPRAPSSALPALEEAGESGFGRESFLRALVVQLAQTVEYLHGPDAADAVVAQVAADVGSQMELEYRLARQVVGAMSPEQMAECYVRLKHAIDGGFYPIEVTPARIVLGNTRCPFGDAVQRAPSLCRMTSSVFGGIAARNNGAPVSVALEERIAVGDPGCRVVVSLTPDAGSEQPDVHRYAPAVDA